MKTLLIKATPTTPSIELNGDGNFTIRGRSLLKDNAHEFYSQIISWLKEYFSTTNNNFTVLKIDLLQLDSESTKSFFEIFSILEEQAQNNNNVLVEWHYDRSSVELKETLDNFADDFATIKVNKKEK